MEQSFSQTTFGRSGIPVKRLGLSATYWPGKKTIYHAIDEGVNVFFCYGFDGQMIRVLRDVSKTRRQDLVIVTGAYNLLIGHPNLRRTLEKRLRQLGTDYIDSFLFLGVTNPKHMTPKVVDELRKFRDEGKVRTIGLSCHDRKFAGQLAAEGALDSFMIRYNAAHRGAEQEIFPNLEKHDPGVISYTATRWSFLLRRPKGWPTSERIPNASMCYRFVLSNPNVDVCLCAPSNMKQLQENLNSLKEGPLSEEDMTFMKSFGDVVRYASKGFSKDDKRR